MVDNTIVSGALFDFLGFLTTREATLSMGSSEEVSPVIDILKEWASERGLSLDEPDIYTWSEKIKPSVVPMVPVGYIHMIPDHITTIEGYIINPRGQCLLKSEMDMEHHQIQIISIFQILEILDIGAQ